MGKTVKDLIYTTIFGKIVPLLQHEKKDGSMALTGENNPLPVIMQGATSTSFVRLSNEPKPTAADGVKDNDDLLLVDTKDVYIYYKGTWYLQ